MFELCRVIEKNNIMGRVVPNKDNSIEKNDLIFIGFGNRN